ncbi:MAG: NAD(P)H-hydrate epimerase, partial [Phycisphaerales bacterium]|nr:NAD(P)H-hydrate epimerase [Phycisphaerales bacterium]
MPNRADHTTPSAISTEIADPRVLSRDELRSLDRIAVEEMGVPSILLMENAAMGAAGCIARMLDVLAPGAVAVLAGTGNNGGDGFAVARHLHILGHAVRVLLVGDEDRLTPDSATNRSALRACGVGIGVISTTDEQVAYEQLLDWLNTHTPPLIVDGLLGTGLSRGVVGPLLGAIRAINRARSSGPAACVVALDLPSGLDADTGRALGDAVRADVTLTFAALK